MEFTEHITTGASRDNAWAAVAGVTTWPTWTKSMREVRPIDADRLAVGNRFRITQPGLPKAVYQVDEVSDGESFTWTYRAPGVRTVGFHRVDSNADGSTEIVIGIRHTGPLARLVAALYGGKTLRFLKMEAAGLKAASEAAAG